MRFLFVVLIYLTGSQALAINYFWCEKNSDCAKVYGGCGRYFGVHKRYKDLYEAKAHKGDRVANCLPPTQEDQLLKFEGQAICQKKRCLLSLKKDKREKVK